MPKKITLKKLLNLKKQNEILIDESYKNTVNEEDYKVNKKKGAINLLPFSFIMNTFYFVILLFLNPLNIHQKLYIYQLHHLELTPQLCLLQFVQIHDRVL